MIVDEEKLLAWCSLLRASGVGSKTFAMILAACESPVAFFSLPESEIKRRLPTISVARWRDWREAYGSGEEDLRWWQADEAHHILLFDDPRYPARLRDIDDPPPVLFVHGDYGLLSVAQLAIVGSRHASQGAMQISHAFARDLVQSGMVITSGLAYGIDAYAHQGALAAGGYTIAVTGTGLDRVYPAKHRELAHKIVEQGALVSELPIGTGVRQSHFPRRNRIISGLSLGVLVVEASIQSGSLITARLAAEQGREVFAIPHSIHNPLGKGCHYLLKQGAKLTENAEDILSELPSFSSVLSHAVSESQPIEKASELDAQAQALLQAIDYSPTSLDEIAARTKLTDGEISAMLLMFELEGLVEALAGQRYQRLC